MESGSRKHRTEKILGEGNVHALRRVLKLSVIIRVCFQRCKTLIEITSVEHKTAA
jgi:hypothetical protein